MTDHPTNPALGEVCETCVSAPVHNARLRVERDLEGRCPSCNKPVDDSGRCLC